MPSFTISEFDKLPFALKINHIERDLIANYFSSLVVVSLDIFFDLLFYMLFLKGIKYIFGGVGHSHDDTSLVRWDMNNFCYE